MSLPANLFQPVHLGRLELRNRMMRSATAERAADAKTGRPTLHMARLYERLAKGGVGLIVTGHAFIRPEGKAHHRMASIVDDSSIAAWRETVAPAQAAGAKVMMQLNHCGASTTPDVNPAPVSPSGVPTNTYSVPEALSSEEIARIAGAFGEAAGRAREAGLDGVQIHGAHGYLVSQFLTPCTNQRTDAWGGSEKKRFAFLKMVYQQVRRAVGDDYPVWIKLGTAGRPDSGLTAAMGARYASMCAEMGIDCIEISHALGEAEGLPDGEGRYRTMAESVRAELSADYPLALVNGFSSVAGMESVVRDNLVQLVSLCRPFIAEPDLVNRLASGDTNRALCVRCNQCWPSDVNGIVDCYNRGVRKKLGRPIDAQCDA